MAATNMMRQMNLLLVLLNSSQPLTRAELISQVDGYGDPDSESVQRKFERDKDDLRKFVNIVTKKDGDGLLDVYWLDKTESFMPDLALTSEERMLMALAAKAWGDAFVKQAANAGVVVSGIDVSEIDAVHASFGSNEKHLAVLMTALADHEVVQFEYFSRHSNEVGTRTVDPWHIALHDDRWYLYGFDHDKQAARMYKLGRIRGVVRQISQNISSIIPNDVDIQAIFDEYQRTELEPTVARIRVPVRDCANLRVNCSKVLNEGEFDIIEITYDDSYHLSHQIALVADRAEVIQPEQLRDLVNDIVMATVRENS